MMRHVTATTAAPAQQLGGNDKPAPTDDVFAMLLGMFATTTIVDVPVDAAPEPAAKAAGKPAVDSTSFATAPIAPAMTGPAAPTASTAPSTPAASTPAPAAAAAAASAPAPLPPTQPLPSADALVTDAPSVNAPDMPHHEVLSVTVQPPRPTTSDPVRVRDKETKLDVAAPTQHATHHGPEPMTAPADDSSPQTDSGATRDQPSAPVPTETHHDSAPKPAAPDPTAIAAAATPVDAAQPTGQAAPIAAPATAPPPAEAIAIQALRLQERGGGRTHVVMRVDPPEIGPVVVSLHVTDSSVEVALHVEDPAAAAALDAQRDAVQQALEANGLSLQQFNVGADARHSGQQDNRPDRRMARTVTAPTATETAPATATREGVWL